MTTTFADPAAGGDKLPLKDLNGALLLIDVVGREPEMQTSFGPASPIRAHVAVLDGTLKGEKYEDALIFPRVLISQLEPNKGKQVLGRLGQGQAKPGQSPAWTLNAATDADRETAAKFVAFQAQQNAKADEPW